MDFENLIPFLFLLIYVFSLLGKKKMQEKEEGKAKSSAKPAVTTLKSVMQTIAAQLKERAEAIKKEEARRMRKEPVPVIRSLLETAFSGAKETAVTPDGAGKEAVPHEPEETAAEEIPLDAPQQEPPARPVPQTTARMRPPAGRYNLKAAVVWSEILGPPVALRGKDRKWL